MAEHLSSQVDFKEFFSKIKTIAVVGYSDKPERAGYFVAHYMQQKGYNIIGVNPKLVPEHNGIQVFASLADIPASITVDVVDVFRAPPVVPGVAEASAKLVPKPKYFFMQPGAESDDGARIATEQGMIPIMNACLMAEHKALG